MTLSTVRRRRSDPRGSARSRGASSSSWSSPRCSPATRSATPRDGRSTSTARPGRGRGRPRMSPASTCSRASAASSTAGSRASRSSRPSSSASTRCSPSRRDCPDAVVVFVDAWTSLGGSQFLNSTATGNYIDYVCDEIVPFIDASYPTAATRERRAVTGHSQAATARWCCRCCAPTCSARLIAHAADTLFEACYMPTSRTPCGRCATTTTAPTRLLLDDFARADTFDWGRWGEAVNTYAMAAAYSPDPDRARQGAAAVRHPHRRADPRGLGALARVRPGADGAALRRRAAGAAPHPCRGRPRRRVHARRRHGGLLRRARPSSASSTRSSCSTAVMAASPTATRPRSGRCWPSEAEGRRPGAMGQASGPCPIKATLLSGPVRAARERHVRGRRDRRAELDLDVRLDRRLGRVR